MSTIFADTFYFLAFLNRRDRAHRRAREWTGAFTGKLMTTEWVLIELADALASSRHRKQFASTRQRLLENPNVEIVPFDMCVYQDGIRPPMKRGRTSSGR